jgi:hypothetical protein
MLSEAPPTAGVLSTSRIASRAHGVGQHAGGGARYGLTLPVRRVPRCARQNTEFLSVSVSVLYFAALIAILGPCLGLAANAVPDYSVEGKLDVWVSGGSPAEKPQTGTFDFCAEVRGDSYRIRMTEPENPTNYFEYTFTEGSMYIFHHKLPTEVFDGTSSRKARPGDGAPFYGAVREGAIPPAEPCRPQFVWFAFISGPYFERMSNNLALPIWSPEDPSLHRQPFEMLAQYRLFDEPPRLPAAVDFINDGFYRSYSMREKALQVVRLSQPYDRGYTNAVYRVLQTTNCGSLVLPAEFLFQVYSSPISPGSKPFERLIVRGSALRVSKAALGRLAPPEFTGVASVVDWRQHGLEIEHGTRKEIPYMAYPVTNASWLGPTQLALLRARIESRVEKRLAVQRAEASAPPGRLAVLRFVLGLFAAVPVTYLIGRAIRRSHRKNRVMNQ